MSHSRAAEKSAIFINVARWFIRPQNTDWQYPRWMVPRLGEVLTDFRFYPCQSLLYALKVNFRYCAGFAARTLGQQMHYDGMCVLNRADLERSGCCVVYSHGDLPVNADRLPVVLRQTILDPAMCFAGGVSQTEFEGQVAQKGRIFARAAAVLVSTEAEAKRIEGYFPGMAGRFGYVPFYLPDVAAVSDEFLEKKTARPCEELRCLFVGRQARRKGLPSIYGALRSMGPSTARRIHLKVVSDFVDGAVPSADLDQVEVLGPLPHPRVMELMRESDVLIMPSRFEGFGIVFVEAMACGTIPMVPNWEIQRELVDYGNAGVVTDRTEADIASALVRLLGDRDYRISLARTAHRRFLTRYAGDVVAQRYRDVFRRVAAAGAPKEAKP